MEVAIRHWDRCRPSYIKQKAQEKGMVTSIRTIRLEGCKDGRLHSEEETDEKEEKEEKETKGDRRIL